MCLIFSPAPFLAVNVAPQWSPTERQKRAKNGAREGMNAAKPGEPGSAKKVGEHRFGLIVRSMGDGDAGAGSCIGERAEVVVAGAARRGFEVGSFFVCLLCGVRGRGRKFNCFLGGKNCD